METIIILFFMFLTIGLASFESYRKRDWRSITAIVANIAIISSLMFAIFQYRLSQSQQRIDRSFSFVNKLSLPPISEAKTRIDKLLWNFYVSYTNQVYRPKLTEKNWRRLSFGLVNGTSEREDIRRDIDVLLDYFDQIEYCVRSFACDAGVTALFLCKQAKNMWYYFYPYIVSIEKNNADYGGAIKRLAPIRRFPKIVDFSKPCNWRDKAQSPNP